MVGTSLSKLKDIVNSRKVFIKELGNSALQEKTFNRTSIVKVQEHVKTNLELKVKLTSLKAIETRTERGEKGCKEQRYVKTKDVRRTHKETFDTKYPGILYKVKKKLAFYFALEVLEPEAYLYLDE